MAKLQIAKKTNTGTGAFTLLDKPLTQHKFRADRLTIKLSPTILNGDGVLPHDLLEESFCQHTTIEIVMRDGHKHFIDMPLRAAEWLSQVQQRGYGDDLVECVDRTIAVGATQTEDFVFDVLFKQPWAKQPEDFSQALSQIKQIKIRVGTTGDANLTVVSVDVEVIAHGAWIKYYHSGIRLQAESLPSQLSTNQALAVNGRLAVFAVYSANNGRSPVSSTNPTLTDGNRDLVDMDDVTTLEMQQFGGNPYPGAVRGINTGIVQTKWGTLLQPEWSSTLTDLPEVENATIKFDSNPGTSGDQQYVVLKQVARGDKAYKNYPGGATRTRAEIERFIERKKLSAGDSIPESMKTALPERVTTPEVRAA